MTRISSLALVSACSGILLGSAVIGAGSIVLVNNTKLQLAFDAPRIHAGAGAEHSVPAKIQTAALTTSGDDDTRRAVRIVYVGPITAR